MTEGPDQTFYLPRRPRYPWEALRTDTPWSEEQIRNLYRNEGELETKGSELSHGRGIEPPFVTQRADQQRRYATPEEGGAYHGKSPRLQEAIIGCGRHRPNRPR
jgi:hypothetical protein